MKSRFARLSRCAPAILAAGLLVSLAPSALLAQASQPASGKPEAAPSAASADAMKAMMDAYAKAAKPGEHHKYLDRLAGKWTVTGKAWMGPGAPADMNGTIESSWELGGRYLHEAHTSTFMGQPFQGFGLDGYDNTTHEFFSAWIDNMGTGLAVFRGTCDAACNVLTETAEEVDPVSGKKQTSREVITFVDADTYHMDMFMVGAGPGGQDLKVMDMTAKRAR